MLPFCTPRRGLCLILSSPSGAGKTTLTRGLLASGAGLKSSVSVTTRLPRAGEVNGEHYFFVSRERFEAMRGGGDLLESAEVYGNFYGTPAQPVKEALEQGRDIVFDVDWQGAASIASLLPQDAVRVFILPPSAEELARRIYTRGTDAKQVIENRLKAAARDMSHWNEYDYVLVNRDIGESLAVLRSILEAERHKRYRQRGLPEFVAGLTGGAPPADAPSGSQADGQG